MSDVPSNPPTDDPAAQTEDDPGLDTPIEPVPRSSIIIDLSESDPENTEFERRNDDIPPPPPPPESDSDSGIGGEGPNSDPDPGRDHLGAPFVSPIDDIRIANKFIECLKNASLDNDEEKLPPDMLYQLRNPHETPLTLDNPDHRLSLDIFLSVSNASEETYNTVRLAILRHHPDDEILTYHLVKKLVTDLSGVSSIAHDMCVHSCIGFTGPFFSLENCPLCGEPRYDPLRKAKVPRKQFHTIPIGPQLQALLRTPGSAHNMRYKEGCTNAIMEELRANNGRKKSPYRDFFDGRDYLDAVAEGKITIDDMVLVFSIDGAQLYRNKASDCWIYIWLLTAYGYGAQLEAWYDAGGTDASDRTCMHHGERIGGQMRDTPGMTC
ncbi:hypothetical protein C8J57DRAFT_1515746 [Mycena rebaudengoi]|nr:hypothetical protein C8J57DRAFT_1515746 [Mycena rebaudengoi]